MNTRDERLEKIMQDASAKLDAQQARIAQLEAQLKTASVALDRAYMIHEQDARNVNFSRCGCDWCKAYRALNGIA